VSLKFNLVKIHRVMVNFFLCSKRWRYLWTCKGESRVTGRSCIPLYPHTSVSILLMVFSTFLLIPGPSLLSAYCDGHLLVFSETHLDVFNTQTAEWVQSIGLKRSRPLSNNGNLTLTYLNDSPLVVYLANMHISGFLERHFDV
jgi:CNH domain